jgi:hypothetical protein
VSFGLITRSTGSTVVITGIRTVFTDTSGIQAPQITLPIIPITLPAPGPTQIFGDSQVTIPLRFGIGCFTGREGTALVIVETSDNLGRRGVQQMRVTVR